MKKLNFVWLVMMVFTLSLINTASAKTKDANIPEGNINWTSLDKVIADAKAGNKKFILVDLYTDWCGWCKKMDEGTFKEQSIVSVMNENFVAAKFNAETPDPVSFNGKTYIFTKTGARGANQLALDLGSVGGKLGYPTLVVLDANGTKLQSFPGFKDVETMSAILKYFQSGNYKTMDFQQFLSGQ